VRRPDNNRPRIRFVLTIPGRKKDTTTMRLDF
jgi:hypothetical protein